MGSKKKIVGGVVGVVVVVVGLALGGMWLLGKAFYEEEVCAYLEPQPALVALTGPVQRCDYQIVDSALLDDADTYKVLVTGERQLAAVYVTSTRTAFDGAATDMVITHHNVLAVAENGDEALLAGERPPVVAVRPFRERPAKPTLPTPSRRRP